VIRNHGPSAMNPTTGAGLLGPGPFGAFEVVQNPRAFSPGEIGLVQTHVLLELPFALHGVTGTYTIDQTCVVTIQIVERPKDVAGYHLGLPVVSDSVEHMRLQPDTWGHVNFTSAILSFHGYRVIVRPEDLEPNEKSDHYDQILSACTETLNPFLDWYSLATGNYAVMRVSAKDFVRFEAWHTLPPQAPRWNHTFVHFPTSQLSFEAPETEGDMELMNQLIAYGKLGDQYSLAFRLYAEAKRALQANDARLAAIQGISSVEVALAHYIESTIRENRDRLAEAGLLEELRISRTGYDECAQNLTLQIELKLLFPLLVPTATDFPKDDTDACDRLRKSRNDAIHEPQRFDPRAVEENLPAVERLLRFFVGQQSS